MSDTGAWIFVLVLFALVVPITVGQVGYYYTQLNDDTYYDYSPDEVEGIKLIGPSGIFSFMSNTFTGLWSVLTLLPIAISGIITTVYIFMIAYIVKEFTRL